MSEYQPISRLLDPFIELFMDSPYSPGWTLFAQCLVIMCIMTDALILCACALGVRRWFWQRKLDRARDKRELALRIYKRL